MNDTLLVDEALAAVDEGRPDPAPSRAIRAEAGRERGPGVLRRAWRGAASASEWAFGAGALVLGLAVLAAVPVVQFVGFGYLLEAGGRVARTGRLRDGLIGVRKAARLG